MIQNRGYFGYLRWKGGVSNNTIVAIFALAFDSVDIDSDDFLVAIKQCRDSFIVIDNADCYIY